MRWDWLKAMLPRGLYGRAALILVLPVIVVTTVVSVVFLQRHFEDVTRQMTESMAHEVTLIAATIAAAPDAATAQAAVAPLAGALRLSVTLPAQSATADRRDRDDFSGRVVIAVLRARLPGLSAVDLRVNRRVVVTLATPHGPARIAFDRRRVSASNPHQLLVLMVFTAALASAIASVFLRNQLRPIRRLAHAAEAFGRGRVLPYRPSGAIEIRSAGTAFLDMRARIERQIESRTAMLSGISHDLRTPLTRLRLGLSMLPEDAPPPAEDVAAMRRDLDEMGALLDAFLDFARGEAAERPPEPVAALAFVAGAVADACRAGLPVTLAPSDADPDARITVRPEALRRALDNLIGNAVRYAGRAEVELALSERALRIGVADNGPGIPEGQREEALRPFARLDPARNQDQGQGVGLGLAIAAEVARMHGGALRLGTSARLGGLQADLVLPR